MASCFKHSITSLLYSFMQFAEKIFCSCCSHGFIEHNILGFIILYIIAFGSHSSPFILEKVFIFPQQNRYQSNFFSFFIVSDCFFFVFCSYSSSFPSTSFCIELVRVYILSPNLTALLLLIIKMNDLTVKLIRSCAFLICGFKCHP